VSSRTSLDLRDMFTWNRTTIPLSVIPWTCRYTTYGGSMPTQIIRLRLKAMITKSRYTVICHINQDHSFGSLSYERQSHSLYQSEFSTECNLVLSLSIFSVLSFPYGYPVVFYVFFLVLQLLLTSFYLYRNA